MQTKEKKVVTLESWAFISTIHNQYQAPELGIPRFRGMVYNHPEREDGDIILTSKVEGYDPDTDEFICFSRRYKLGKVDPSYEECFHNAKERLIKAFIERAKNE